MSTITKAKGKQFAFLYSSLFIVHFLVAMYFKRECTYLNTFLYSYLNFSLGNFLKLVVFFINNWRSQGLIIQCTYILNACL